ncbi:MAG: hypothetical protein J6J04_02310 [Oscillospiraceae bacterium]|nr:hypothetical protein [Oscillospiraceae bacterium]
MEFTPINGFGLIIVLLMLLPNILYTVRFPGVENRCTNAIAIIAEQIGRYASMALMVLPLGVWKFGFLSTFTFLLYLIGNTVLLVLYWVFWFLYFKKQTCQLALSLAITPSLIFLLSGLTLHHWLLVISGTLFAVSHIYITYVNHK